jgi:uncharacterized caspase-like protein
VPPQAVNPHDHAVVIAIRRYADVAAGWITTLEGPDNDAAAVADWLKASDGGGLPEANVRVVGAADVPDPFPDGRAVPNQERVIAALDEIAQLPKNSFEGQFAGRRLYVHITGHGWAREPDEAALVTAEATLADPVNVLVTSWTRWMHKAAPFKQLVLWADTCATRTPLKVLQPCVLAESVSANTKDVQLFEGFAAPLGYRAVENQMPDGSWHGAFTYALLEGLKGSARSPVTSSSLRDYLHNTMKDFMSDDQRKRKTVAHEPAFGRVDPIDFPTKARPTFPVTLQFAQEHVGRRVFVGTGRSDPPVDETVLQATQWTVHLEAGFWGVFVDETDISKGLEVAGGGTDAAVAIP